MSTMQVSQRIAIEQVPPHDTDLQAWVQTLRSRLPRSVRDLSAPEWTGIYCDGKLFAAMSYVCRADNSIFIDGLVCRPNKLGIKYAITLWLSLKHLWQGRKISFCVATNNRKMLDALTKLTSAKPVAAVFEMEA